MQPRAFIGRGAWVGSVRWALIGKAPAASSPIIPSDDGAVKKETPRLASHPSSLPRHLVPSHPHPLPSHGHAKNLEKRVHARWDDSKSSRKRQGGRNTESVGDPPPPSSSSTWSLSSSSSSSSGTVTCFDNVTVLLTEDLANIKRPDGHRTKNRREMPERPPP